MIFRSLNHTKNRQIAINGFLITFTFILVSLVTPRSALAQIDNLVPIVTFTGSSVPSTMGQSVSDGDFNNDGYEDVVVGAYNTSAGGTCKGQVYVYYGGVPMDNIADVTFTGVSNYDFLGFSVSAGDVNNDGYDDVVVGAPYVNAGGTDKGQAYVYYGGSSMDSIADVTFTGGASNEFLGISVSMDGDFNSDGFDDVIVGAYGVNANKGAAYIYYGGNSMDNIADVTFSGSAINDYFGTSVSSAGDVNNDSFTDIMVGAYMYADGNKGKVYLFYGGVLIENIADVTFSGVADNDRFGTASAGIHSVGDINNDSYDDVIIGATGVDVTDPANGQAYIYYGGISMDNIADVTFTGIGTSTNFGYAVASAGDVNNDGYIDVLIGAYATKVGGVTKGQTYIYYGGNSMDNIADVTFTGNANSDLMGYSVSSAGDVNNDGYQEVIVGAAGYNGWQGQAYIYSFNYGSPSISLVPVTYSNDATPDLTGTAIDAGVNVGGVQWSLTNEVGGIWNGCTADDGAFDEDSETFSCTMSPLTDGSHTIYFRSFDANMVYILSSSYDSLTFSIDTVSPSISLDAFLPNPSLDNTPLFSGMVQDDLGIVTGVQYQMDGTDEGWTACTAGDGVFNEGMEDFTCTVSGELSDGVHTIYIRGSDSYGNTTSPGSETSNTFTIDTTAPEFDPLPNREPPINISNGEVLSAGTTVIEVIPNDQNGIEKVEFYVGDALICTVTEADTDGVYRCSWKSEEGTYTVRVVAYDELGNKTELLRTVSVVENRLYQTGHPVWLSAMMSSGVFVVMGMTRRKMRICMST